MKETALMIMVVAITAGVSCGAKSEDQPKDTAMTEVSMEMAIQMPSTAFEKGQSIPSQYTCDGENVSPPLSWTGVPDSAKSLALICDDPDAPRGTFVHWVLYNIPADTMSLPENVPGDTTLAIGAVHGKTDFGRLVGYCGPCPPGGTHRYYFKLYALDTVLQLTGRVTKQVLLDAMEGHVLAQGQLMGRYERTR